jgi:hypothetical protein
MISIGFVIHHSKTSWQKPLGKNLLGEKNNQ